MVVVPGVLSAGVLVVAFLVFGSMTPGFDLLRDYISSLGAVDRPWGVWWNLTGFVGTGLLFAVFGWYLGIWLQDRWVGLLLVIAGIGFAVAAIPADFLNSQSPMTKAHVVSICMSLAGWCFALARLGYVEGIDRRMKPVANMAGVAVVLPMIASATELFPAPIAHRLVLAVIFGWVIFVCWICLQIQETKEQPE